MTKASVAAAAAFFLAGCGGQEAREKSVAGGSNDLVVNWSATGNETDPNAAFGAQFGSSVATNGNWIAVARQPATSTDIGRVEVWQRSGTGWAHKFTWPGQVGHNEVVAMSAGAMFIGEPCIATSGCSGAVFGLFLFNNGTTWTEEIQSINVNPPDFGRALAMNGNTVAVTGGGAVSWFFYDFQTFFLLDTFTEPATPYLSSGFGSSIAVTNHGVAVGAPNGIRFAGKLGSHRSPGFVYVFGPSHTNVTRLTGVGTEDPPAGSGFGASVGTSQDGLTLAVGAGSEVGRSMTAYVFHENTSANTWSQSNVIGPPSGATGSSIGVAIDGGLLGVTTGNGSTGTVRFFSFSGPLGAQQNASFALDFPRAPIDLRSGRAIVGQPDFFGSAGYIATYAGTQPVIAQPPPGGALNP